MTDIQILKRLFNDYTKKYFKKILVSVLFSFILAGSTSAVAYLLDPAIKHLFINKQQSLMLIIPFFIILAFSVKGLSLYIAKVIMIGVSEEVRKDIQTDMFGSLISIGFLMKLNYYYFIFIALAFIQMFFFQIKKLKINDSKICLNIFKSNNFLGSIIFISLIVGKI